jgi:3-dehydroquinate synthase
MKKITVKLKSNQYDILIKNGLLSQIGDEIRSIALCAGMAALITDSNVERLYGDMAEKSLRNAGFATRRIVIAPGESSKNLATAANIYEGLADFGLTRSDIVVTLGGGVVGDIGGFTASTFLRGIPYVHVPTSLMAQVDSSVGGKTAVDLPAGKNMVGCFAQPLAVFIDPQLLATLDKKFMTDGMAEVVKYGCIRDVNLFEFLESHDAAEEILPHIEDIIYNCCSIKSEIVTLDERDKGLRMLLNFGHTVGHSLEKISRYKNLTHGEGVAIGMCAVAKSGERLGITEAGTYERIKNLLSALGLPHATDIPLTEIADGIRSDKKRLDGKLTLVLLKKIGEGMLKQIKEDEIPLYIGGD